MFALAKLRHMVAFATQTRDVLESTKCIPQECGSRALVSVLEENEGSARVNQLDKTCLARQTHKLCMVTAAIVRCLHANWNTQ